MIEESASATSADEKDRMTTLRLIGQNDMGETIDLTIICSWRSRLRL
jgi:hypothetical protein